MAAAGNGVGAGEEVVNGVEGGKGMERESGDCGSDGEDESRESKANGAGEGAEEDADGTEDAADPEGSDGGSCDAVGDERGGSFAQRESGTRLRPRESGRVRERVRAQGSAAESVPLAVIRVAAAAVQGGVARLAVEARAAAAAAAAAEAAHAAVEAAAEEAKARAAAEAATVVEAAAAAEAAAVEAAVEAAAALERQQAELEELRAALLLAQEERKGDVDRLAAAERENEQLRKRLALGRAVAEGESNGEGELASSGQSTAEGYGELLEDEAAATPPVEATGVETPAAEAAAAPSTAGEGAAEGGEHAEANLEIDSEANVEIGTSAEPSGGDSAAATADQADCHAVDGYAQSDADDDDDALGHGAPSDANASAAIQTGTSSPSEPGADAKAPLADADAAPAAAVRTTAPAAAAVAAACATPCGGHAKSAAAPSTDTPLVAGSGADDGSCGAPGGASHASRQLKGGKACMRTDSIDFDETLRELTDELLGVGEADLARSRTFDQGEETRQAGGRASETDDADVDADAGAGAGADVDAEGGDIGSGVARRPAIPPPLRMRNGASVRKTAASERDSTNASKGALRNMKERGSEATYAVSSGDTDSGGDAGGGGGGAMRRQAEEGMDRLAGGVNGAARGVNGAAGGVNGPVADEPAACTSARASTSGQRRQKSLQVVVAPPMTDEFSSRADAAEVNLLSESGDSSTLRSSEIANRHDEMRDESMDDKAEEVGYREPGVVVSRPYQRLFEARAQARSIEVKGLAGVNQGKSRELDRNGVEQV
eukprot:4515603-Pleurochrysis_carterae.AAC.2